MAYFLALASAALYGAADFLGGLASRRASTIAIVLVSQAVGLVPLDAAAARAAWHTIRTGFRLGRHRRPRRQRRRRAALSGARDRHDVDRCADDGRLRSDAARVWWKHSGGAPATADAGRHWARRVAIVLVSQQDSPESGDPGSTPTHDSGRYRARIRVRRRDRPVLSGPRTDERGSRFVAAARIARTVDVRLRGYCSSRVSEIATRAQSAEDRCRVRRGRHAGERVVSARESRWSAQRRCDAGVAISSEHGRTRAAGCRRAIESTPGGGRRVRAGGASL